MSETCLFMSVKKKPNKERWRGTQLKIQWRLSGEIPIHLLHRIHFLHLAACSLNPSAHAGWWHINNAATSKIIWNISGVSCALINIHKELISLRDFLKYKTEGLESLLCSTSTTALTHFSALLNCAGCSYFDKFGMDLLLSGRKMSLMQTKPQNWVWCKPNHRIPVKFWVGRHLETHRAPWAGTLSIGETAPNPHPSWLWAFPGWERSPGLCLHVCLAAEPLLAGAAVLDVLQHLREHRALQPLLVPALLQVVVGPGTCGTHKHTLNSHKKAFSPASGNI